MAIKNIDTKVLDDILAKMITTVRQSKQEIVSISEQCKIDFQATVDELRATKKKIADLSHEVNRLETDVRKARKRLSEVSMNMSNFSEEIVRKAFEEAHNCQLKLSMNRQLELQIVHKREDLERRLYSLQQTIIRADNLVSQITVILNYITADVTDMTNWIKDAEEKQELGLKIIEAQEEERKRLSREIHDGPAQILANVMMQSDLIEKVIQSQGVDTALQEIQHLKKIIRDALYEVRYIIYDLRPMSLDDLGLIPTLKKFLQTIEDYHHDIVITFSYYGTKKRLHPKMEVALFRLIQESVQNAVKHSKSEKIKVELDINCDRVSVIVEDDGVGFNCSEKRENTFGIRGMKERVELLEGEFNICSEKGKGTSVHILIPVK